MKIQVLGSGCAACKDLHKTVEEVVKKLNLDTEVEYSTDITKIVKLGAMSSPVLAIEGKLITSGKVPTDEEIEQAIFAEQKGEPVQINQPGRSECSCGDTC